MTLLLVNRRKEALVTGIKGKAYNTLYIQSSQFLPKRLMSITFARREATQNYYPQTRDKKMEALRPGYLTCPILPKMSVSKLKPGGLFTTRALEVIFKYLIIMQAKISTTFHIFFFFL